MAAACAAVDVLLQVPEHKSEAVVTIGIVAPISPVLPMSLAFQFPWKSPLALENSECGEIPSAQVLPRCDLLPSACLTGIKLLALSHNLPEISISHQSFNVI